MPNNWKTYKLGEVADIKGGKRLPKGDVLLTSVTNHPYIRVTDMGTRTIPIEKLQYVPDDVFPKISRYIVNTNDLILSIVGTVGSISIIDKKLDNASLTENCVKITNMKNIDSEYLYYYLISDIGQFEIIKGIVGSTQPKLPIYNINNLDISLPSSIQEQKSIAAILSSIDDKIENNLAINKTLEEMAMVLYKHWFVDFGPFQDGEFVESELGMIPKDWKVKKLGSIVSVLGGYAFKSAWFQDSGVKVLKIKNINNNIVDIHNCTCISEEISKTINPKFRVTKGDFLIAMTGAEVGKVGAVPDYNQELWLNQRVGKLVDKELKNASILIGKLLQTNDFYKLMQGLAYGSAQPNISTSDIESIKIALPIDKSILNEIIDEFVSSHEIIIQNLTENQTLTQLRDTLLPKLISGEVRLKEFRES